MHNELITQDTRTLKVPSVNQTKIHNYNHTRNKKRSSIDKTCGSRLTGTMGGGAPGGGANEVKGIGTPVGTPEGIPAEEAAAAPSSRSRERERLRDLDRSRRREARGSEGILVVWVAIALVENEVN